VPSKLPLRLFLVGLAGLLIAPAGVSAATKSQSATLTAKNQVITLTPRCPRGQRATGGGFRASSPTLDGASPSVFIQESQKIGQRSWRVTGQQADAPGPMALTAYVYCSADAPRTKTVATTVLSPNGSTTFSSDATCKSGKAQAGGFLTNVGTVNTSENNLVLESYRFSKKSWRGRALNSSSSPGHPFTTYVYCADADLPKARSGSATGATGNTLVTAVSAQCKDGTHPGAGGFRQPAPNAFYLLFYESFRNGKRWQVSARLVPPVTTPLTATAYCV
jgi:hypothetical protein